MVKKNKSKKKTLNAKLTKQITKAVKEQKEKDDNDDYDKLISSLIRNANKHVEKIKKNTVYKRKTPFKEVDLPQNKLVSKLNKNELLNLDKMGDCRYMNAKQIRKEVTSRKKEYRIPKGLTVAEYNLYANKH